MVARNQIRVLFLRPLTFSILICLDSTGHPLLLFALLRIYAAWPNSSRAFKSLEISRFSFPSSSSYWKMLPRGVSQISKISQITESPFFGQTFFAAKNISIFFLKPFFSRRELKSFHRLMRVRKFSEAVESVIALWNRLALIFDFDKASIQGYLWIKLQLSTSSKTWKMKIFAGFGSSSLG